MNAFSTEKGALGGAFFSWKRLVWQPAFNRLLRRWRINDRYVEDLFDDLSRSLFEAPGEKHQASDQQDETA